MGTNIQPPNDLRGFTHPIAKTCDPSVLVRADQLIEAGDPLGDLIHYFQRDLKWGVWATRLNIIRVVWRLGTDYNRIILYNEKTFWWSECISSCIQTPNDVFRLRFFKHQLTDHKAIQTLAAQTLLQFLKPKE